MCFCKFRTPTMKTTKFEDEVGMEMSIVMDTEQGRGTKHEARC